MARSPRRSDGKRNQGHVAASPAEAAGNICRGWHGPRVLAGPVRAELGSAKWWQVEQRGGLGTGRAPPHAPLPVPASHPRRLVPLCVGAQLCSQPKLFPRPPRHPLSEPGGLGLCSPAGEEAKTLLEKQQARICSPNGTTQAVPGSTAQPRAAAPTPPGPGWHPQHPAPTRRRGTAPSPSLLSTSASFSLCLLTERRCSRSHSPGQDWELSPAPCRAGSCGSCALRWDSCHPARGEAREPAPGPAAAAADARPDPARTSQKPRAFPFSSAERKLRPPALMRVLAW